MSRFFSLFPWTLVIILWFGFMAGFLEGMTANLLRGVPGFGMRVSTEILWIAPAFNLILFLFMGAGILAIYRLSGKPAHPSVFAGLFIGAIILSLLLLLGIIHKFAALMLSLGLGIQASRWLKDKEKALLSFFRYTVGFLAASVLLAGAIGAAWDGVHERRMINELSQPRHNLPNVLLIVLDTLRADHLSCYGYMRRTTPHIDRLARSGVLFEKAMANSSWTLPSHVSLLTGRLPHEHKADWLDPYKGNYLSLAEVLAERGYQTGAFSANTEYVSPEWGLGRGFAHFETYGSSLADHIVRTVYGRRIAQNLLPRLGYFDIPGRKRASDVNREFLGWVDGIRGRPFFALLNYMEVHDPYLTVSSYQTKFSEDPSQGDLINFRFGRLFRRKPSLTSQEIQREIDAYDGCLNYLDEQLGKLFHGLDRRGLNRNTLVILTSDHGESFGNHDLFGHGNSLYIETLWVPLIFSWPGRIPSGVRVSRVVSLHEIPGTVLALLGEKTPSSMRGKSLARFWSGDVRDTGETVVFSEVSPGRFKGGPPNYPTASGGIKSLITEQWHFILSDSGALELYAWRKDPEELRNLAESPEGRRLIREFKGMLKDLLEIEVSSGPKQH